MHRTPTKELKVINAQLDSATECIAQANNRLIHLQDQAPAQESLLIQFRTTLTQLQKQYIDLEKRILNLSFSQREGPDL